jgi:hypothetical protein
LPEDLASPDEGDSFRSDQSPTWDADRARERLPVPMHW